MDYLEKYEAEQEARREYLDHMANRGQDDQHGHQTDMPDELYPVVIIGCIRGQDGNWYQAGYDRKTKTIRPLKRLEEA